MKAPRIVKLPDLDFIIEGTKSITQGNGILALFCPHDEYCLKTDVDANCFMEKFFHCDEARELEKIHELNRINKFYLKYKNIILQGGYFRK